MREMQPSQRYRALKSHCHALTAFPAQRKKKQETYFQASTNVSLLVSSVSQSFGTNRSRVKLSDSRLAGLLLFFVKRESARAGKMVLDFGDES